jgi:hypothetical protein
LKPKAKKIAEKIKKPEVEYKEFLTYQDAYKDPYNYYSEYCGCWYLYLDNSKGLSKKSQLHKLIFKEELKRINKWVE